MKKNALLHYMAASAAAIMLMTPASGQLSFNFDDATNPFATTGSGAISSDHAASGSSSLYLPAGSLAAYAIPSEYLGQNIVVTMKVLDLGRWIDSTVQDAPLLAYGPRWGVGNGTATSALGLHFVSIDMKERNSNPTIASTVYGFRGPNGIDTTDASASITSSIHDAVIYGDRAILVTDGGSNDGSGWVASVPDPFGVWTEWTFNISALGEVSANLLGSDAMTATLADPVTYIYLHGGRTGALSDMAGIYFDDITVSVAAAVPEPQTIGLLLGCFALGGVFFVRRKRRS